MATTRRVPARSCQGETRAIMTLVRWTFLVLPHRRESQNVGGWKQDVPIQQLRLSFPLKSSICWLNVRTGVGRLFVVLVRAFSSRSLFDSSSEPVSSPMFNTPSTQRTRPRIILLQWGGAYFLVVLGFFRDRTSNFRRLLARSMHG
jgi:hypothetical protein